GAEMEEVVLDPRQHGIGLACRMQARHADRRIGLVDRAVGGDAPAVLCHALAAAERGLALVAAPGVDARELDHGSRQLRCVIRKMRRSTSKTATAWAATRKRMKRLPYLRLKSPPRAMLKRPRKRIAITTASVMKRRTRTAPLMGRDYRRPRPAEPARRPGANAGATTAASASLPGF